MRVLILTQYFYPEINAPSHRYKYLAGALVKAGHKVTVICETPNYPRGEIFRGYRNRLVGKEKIDGISVIRSWVWITKRRDSFSRILNYFSFFVSSIFASIVAGKMDVVVASSPPLPVIFSGLIISKVKRAKLVPDIRDIWPDSAIRVGMMERGNFYRFMEFLEKFVYRHSNKIMVNAEGIKKVLISNKQVPAEKIGVFTNGAELDLFKPDVDTSGIDEEFGLVGKFVVEYAGLIGLAQDPETIISAAEKLKDNKDIVFLLVGEGPLKKKCEEKTRQLGLDNVIFAGEQPRAKMPAFVARADLTLVTYKNDEFFKGVIPSKIFDYMAAAKPVLINLDGEGAKIIKEAGCGVIAKAGDATDLVKELTKFYEERSLLKMGLSGRKFVQENYDRDKISIAMLEFISSLA